MEDAFLQDAHLERADMWGAHLETADLHFSHLEGTELSSAHLQGANLRETFVDRLTRMNGCLIDVETDCRGVNLELPRLDVGTKVLLEYNWRRMNWEDLYDEDKWHPRWMWRNTVVRVFWWLSDYGRSPARILACFAALSLVFAGIYSLCPGLLVADNEVTFCPASFTFNDEGSHPRSFLHSLYFSVVTMTTLGFGDIHANPSSGAGQCLLIIQVMFGYALLGALMAFLGIIWTRDGPAGKFARTWKPAQESPELTDNNTDSAD